MMERITRASILFGCANRWHQTLYGSSKGEPLSLCLVTLSPFGIDC